jgi:hypothetical protein
MAGWPSCHLCGKPIERRYSIVGPRSTAQGYWAHLETEEGIAADENHEAIYRPG